MANAADFKPSIPLDFQQVAARIAGLAALADLASWLLLLSQDALAAVVRSDPARFAALATEAREQAAYLASLSESLAALSERLSEAQR